VSRQSRSWLLQAIENQRDEESMMRNLKFLPAFVMLGATLGLIGPAAAADSSSQSQGSVSFVSGGVGVEDEQRIKEMRSQYPLELLFVTRGNPNQYLSDVKVQIMDRSGKSVLDTVASGPYLLAKVPPGRYTVMGDNQGSVKKQSVQVGGGKTQRVMFVWPPIEEQPPVK
jgi:hypothetical protein